MKRLVFLAAVFALSMTAGCLTPPQTPDEFRQYIPGAWTGKVVNVEVDRSLGEVAATYKKMAPRCFDVRLTSSGTTRNGQIVQRTTLVQDYNATVIARPNKAEVYVQQKIVAGAHPLYKVPPGGSYLLVADAVPEGKKKTKVTIYSVSAYDKLINGVETWSKGQDLCPDLTQ